MLRPFVTVVYYAHYRLENTMANTTTADLRHIPRLKSQVDQLHRTLQHFTRFKTMMLLCFPFYVISTLRIYDKSESVTLHVFSFLLSEEVKNAYDAQVNPGTATSPLQATWR